MAIPPPLPGPTGGLRIGLFGGSFNPAHSGHLHVARTAMSRLQLDWVWWIVAAGNPLKDEHGDFDARIATARAIADGPRMRVTDIERKLGFTYAIDTLAWLRGRAPAAHFVWIMGGDSICNFHLWKNWQQIAALMPIAVVARPGFSVCAYHSPFAQRYRAVRLPQHAAETLAHTTAPSWAYLTAPLNAASSTALRAEAENK